MRKESGGLPALLAALKAFGQDEAFVCSAGRALKTATVFDDYRKDFAGAFDAQRLAVELGFVSELLRAAAHHDRAGPSALAAIFLALKGIACNDDAVQQICAGGGLALAEAQLERHAGDAAVCRSAAALLRNLAGNDAVKTSLCTISALSNLFGAVRAHGDDAALAEHVIATLAAMALRVPANCDRILALGGAKILTGSLRRWPSAAALQRQACLAVRNLVGRSPHLKEPLLDDNMEALLRHAGTLPGSVDAAFAALRDLGLEVEMITVDAYTGEVRKGVQQFGEVKSSFRAVYDDDPIADAARYAAMAEAAKSPAELGYKM